MCLRTKQKRLKLAKEGITVYKIIRVKSTLPKPKPTDIFGVSVNDVQRLLDSPEYYKYVSYYQDAETPKACIEKGKKCKAKGRTEKTLSGKGKDYECYLYSGGLIHSFKDESTAIEVVQSLPFFLTDSTTIVYKCTIPKLTRYVSGKDDSFAETYASKKIIFNEPVYFGETAKKWNEMKHNM